MSTFLRLTLPFVCYAVLLGCVALPSLGQVNRLSGEDRSRVIVWLTIGGATRDRATARLPRDLLEGGWETYIRLKVRPMIRGGVRRFVLANPYGYRGSGPFQFDQKQDLEDLASASNRKDLEQLIETFEAAWLPVTRGDYSNGEPIEVICYLGKLKDDPDFTDLPSDEWDDRFNACIGPALNAGMSLGFDASSGIHVDSREHRAIEALQAQGVTCYIEARPLRASPWRHAPVIAVDDIWRITEDTTQPPNQKYYPTPDLTGEIVRFVPPNRTPNKNERLDAIGDVIREGHTVAVGTNDIWQVARLAQLMRQEQRDASTSPE